MTTTTLYLLGRHEQLGGEAMGLFFDSAPTRFGVHVHD